MNEFIDQWLRYLTGTDVPPETAHTLEQMMLPYGPANS